MATTRLICLTLGVLLCVCKPLSFLTTSESSEITTATTTIAGSSTTCSSLEECEADLNVTTTVHTEIQNNTELQKKNKNSEIKKRVKPSMSHAHCTCNFHLHFCDINCCCDPDCSANDKKVFKYCEKDSNRHVDDRYCSYMEHIYINNTSTEWQVNRDGLFCIVNSNLPQSHLVQNERVLSFAEAFKSKAVFWPSNYLNNLSRNFTKSYVYGDPVVIIKNDSSLDFLRLPKNVLTSPCLTEKEIQFLKTSSSKCGQINIYSSNPALQFSSYFRNLKVVVNPPLVNQTNIKGSLYLNCPKNACIEIEPHLCDPCFNNCTKLDNTTNIKFHCSFDVKKNLNYCYNAPKKIFYRMYHNATRGLQKIEILGVLTNFSYNFGNFVKRFEFFQEFSVEFLWLNQTQNYSEIFSGNPGYIIGKPILVGTKLNLRTNNTNFDRILRSSDKFIDNFLVFHSHDREGKCVRNSSLYLPLEFGINLKSKCRFNSILSFNKSSTATHICTRIQQAIFSSWGISPKFNQILVFGLFGNALSSSLEDWGEVLYKIDPRRYLSNYTRGNFSSNTLLCHNISTLLNVEIFYSRIALKNLLNQNKILGLTYTFLDTRDHIFLVNTSSKMTKISLTLQSQVTFNDVTRKGERKFVNPPNWDIRLPYDFFYPFIKIGNGVQKMESATSFWVTVNFLMLKFFV
ncbi:tectonic-1 [Euwallacea fornicatus]|uniref:tectonic-1 n=1 Tax=Euwallacea fornicatus TaxID=995702 RepID=UPI00338DFE74